jgi:hypothetical protein
VALGPNVKAFSRFLGVRALLRGQCCGPGSEVAVLAKRREAPRHATHIATSGAEVDRETVHLAHREQRHSAARDADLVLFDARRSHLLGRRHVEQTDGRCVAGPAGTPKEDLRMQHSCSHAKSSVRPQISVQTKSLQLQLLQHETAHGAGHAHS